MCRRWCESSQCRRGCAISTGQWGRQRGGEAPELADENEANAIIGAIMGRYNEILRQIDHDEFGPIFWAAHMAP
jgi:hypothetical protein